MENKVIGVFAVCNTAGICVHEIDHAEDRVLASMNGIDPEWYPITEKPQSEMGGDSDELESCYGLLFSGDTLFAGSCGRTDFAGGSMQEMQKSLSLLAELPLPDATTVLPGHGESSTLGQERNTNPYMNGAWY